MEHLKMFGLAAAAAMALTAVIGAATASATTLYVGGASQAKAVSIVATLSSGSTAVLKDEGGTTQDTCNISEVKSNHRRPVQRHDGRWRCIGIVL